MELGNLLRSALENSQEEFVSLHEEINSVKGYMRLQSNFSKKFNFTIEMDDRIDPYELLIPPMFIQPFVENSIQHCLKGRL